MMPNFALDPKDLVGEAMATGHITVAGMIYSYYTALKGVGLSDELAQHLTRDMAIVMWQRALDLNKDKKE